MTKRSPVKPCVYCNHPIFFDDSVLPGKPLEYDQNQEARPHRCSRAGATKAITSSETRMQESMLKRLDDLEARMKAVEGKVS